MIRLTGIKKVGHQLVCFAFIEDSAESISMSFDIETGELHYSTPPKGYERCGVHVRMAKKVLREMAESNKIETNRNVVWC